jgi:hypothetical protein
LRPPLLWPFNRNYLSGPIQIFEAQSADFATSQSVYSQQHQDRVIPDVAQIFSAGAVYKALDVGPERTSGKSFLFEEPRRVDGGGDSGGTPTPHLGMSKE